MTKRMKRIFAFLCASALLVSTVLGTGIMKGAKAADSEPTPVTLEGFDTITIENLADKQGNPMAAGEYTGATNGAHNVFYATGLANLDKKLLSLKITFEGGAYKHSLIFGGNGGWCGFNLHPNGDGSALVIDQSWAGSITTMAEAPIMYATTAGVDSFINEEFLLQMSLEYGEVDANNKADLTIGVYINGKLYNDQTFTIADCNMANAGNVVALYREVEGSSIIVKSINDTEIKPAVVDGFQTVSIENFSNSEGTMPAGTYEGAAGGAHKDYSVASLTNFDKALVSLKATFTAGTYRTRLDVGGNAGWTGFSVNPNEDGSVLQIRDNYGMTDMADENLPTLSAATAGVTSFINNEFILQMSFEYSGTDLTLGVYINGKLYNDQKFTITDCNMSKVGSHLAFYGEDVNGAVILASINETEEPDDSDDQNTPSDPAEFTDVTIKDFVDANGAQMPEQAYDNASEYGSMDTFLLKNGESLDGKRLSMKVKFEGGGGNTRIDVAGGGEWTGFSIYASETSNYLHIYTNYGVATPAQGFDIDLSDTGLTSVLNTEFLLQMTIDFVDGDTDSVIVGLYVNETSCGTYTITNCDLSKFGGYIGLYREKMNSVITVGSYPEQVVETPSEDLAEVTYSDFGIKEKVYKYVSGDLAVQGALAERNSLAGTIAGGDIELTGDSDYQIIFGGSNSGWDGLRMMTNNERIHTYWYQGNAGTFVKTLYPATAGVDFVGSKFNLKVSMELVDNDGDGQVNDIKVGYWFNDALYENSYEIISNVGDQLGNKFGVYCANESDTVTIGTPSADDGGEDDDTPKQPNANLTSYTWSDFGINDKTYKHNGDLAVSGTLKGKTSLAGTIVGGDIQLDGTGLYQLIFGGGGNAWDGLRLMTNDNNIHVYWFGSTGGTFIKTLSPATAGVDFVGEKYNLKVSMELVDDAGDGKVNDIQVGIWFNDVLYGNEYLIVANQGGNLANKFSVYCEQADDTVTIGTPSADADKPIQPDESFEKLTFAHFGIKDATYPYNGDIVVQGTWEDKETINKTVICGDILMPAGGNYQLLFGAKENVWDGLRLIASDNNIHVYWYQGHEGTYIKSLFPQAAGVSFTGEEFNLMLSTELIDYDGDGKKNDTRFGIWFNGVLYDNEYMILSNHGTELGNTMGAYCATEGTSVTLTSIAELAPEPEPLKMPNKDFRKITFSHFGVEDGTHKYDGTDYATAEGTTYKSLDRTVLCGDIRLDGIGDTHLMYGGVSNVWYGFRFIQLSNGNLALYWIDEDVMNQIEIFDPTTAGTQLVDTWFNIMISTEIVDADGDGEKDDIELGVWFNEVLYKNKYITVLDEAKDFGKCFGFDCATKGTSVSIKSIPELVEGFDYSIYGLDENWEDTLLKTGLKAGLAVGGSKDAGPFSGDLLKTGTVWFFGIAAVASLVVGIYLVLKRKKVA